MNIITIENLCGKEYYLNSIEKKFNKEYSYRWKEYSDQLRHR